jgi:hypothetical protein
MTTYEGSKNPSMKGTSTDVKINKWVDFADRVGWTAIQALGGAIITVLATDVTWEQGLIFVGTAVLLAIAKVFVAQNVGGDGMGDLPLPGQQVIEK